MTGTSSPRPPSVTEVPSADRLHALDAVRSFALLIGVVLHSTLAWVMPPGQWGVGTNRPNLALWGFTHYVHDFRMQLFFLLAGFFGALVVARRGERAYLRDRGLRIGLVLVVLLYPIKLLINLPWIAGGLKTGWLDLPPEIARLPLVDLAVGALNEEVWPAVSPTHLWFLYYLLLVTAAFLAARWALARVPGRTGAPGGRGLRAASSRVLERLLARPLGPVVLALPLTPLLRLTPGGVLASPDRGFVPDGPAVALYGLCFALGWWLFGRRGLLDAFARWWILWLVASLVTGALSFVLELVHRTVGLDPGQHWLAAAANALTLTFACTGWTGLFVARFSAPSVVVRYLADASYWVYLIHLPIVVALQVWVSDWGVLPLQLLVINVGTFAVSLVSYHWLVRDTPLGLWLNGRRHRTGRSAVAPPG